MSTIGRFSIELGIVLTSLALSPLFAQQASSAVPVSVQKQVIGTWHMNTDAGERWLEFLPDGRYIEWTDEHGKALTAPKDFLHIEWSDPSTYNLVGSREYPMKVKSVNSNSLTLDIGGGVGTFTRVSSDKAPSHRSAPPPVPTPTIARKILGRWYSVSATGVHWIEYRADGTYLEDLIRPGSSGNPPQPIPYKWTGPTTYKQGTYEYTLTLVSDNTLRIEDYTHNIETFTRTKPDDATLARFSPTTTKTAQYRGPANFAGKWACIPGDPNAKLMALDFHGDGTLGVQVVGAGGGTVKYTTSGNTFVFGTDAPQEFRFISKDTFWLAAPVLHGQTCRRTIPMPVQSTSEPDESYAWKLVMHEVNSMWDGVFAASNGAGCVGSQITTMPNVNWEQIRGFRPNVRTELLPLNQADRLNGVQFRSRFYFSVQAARYYDPRTGWGRWDTAIGDAMVPGQQNFGIFTEKQNGAWTVNLFGTNLFYKRYAATCDSMPN